MKYKLYYHEIPDDAYECVTKTLNKNFNLYNSSYDYPFVLLNEEQALLLKLRYQLELYAIPD
jgi:hypothetical protein